LHPFASPCFNRISLRGNNDDYDEEDDMKAFNPAAYAADKLGEVQAEIAKLREFEKTLKGMIFNAGEKSVEGSLFRATVIEAERDTVNWKKIATDLEASAQRIRANTKTSTVTSIKVTALSTAARRAA
jgi:hypothetical protein